MVDHEPSEQTHESKTPKHVSPKKKLEDHRRLFQDLAEKFRRFQASPKWKARSAWAKPLFTAVQLVTLGWQLFHVTAAQKTDDLRRELHEKSEQTRKTHHRENKEMRMEMHRENLKAQKDVKEAIESGVGCVRLETVKAQKDVKEAIESAYRSSWFWNSK